MALLRNTLRYLRSVRLFSTEINSLVEEQSFIPRKRSIIHRVQEGDYKINKLIACDDPVNPDTWVSVRKELMLSPTLEITESNVDMVVVNVCLKATNINMAMSYLRYIWESQKEMKLMPMATYLELCGVKNDRQLNEIEKKYLIDMYKKIREKYPVMDSKIAGHCVVGITKTELWKDSLELLNILALSGKPRSGVYAAIINAAFRNNEPEMAWKYMSDILTYQNLHHNVYIEYLDYCQRNFHGTQLENEIFKIFQLWGDLDVHPYVAGIEAYEKKFRELGWDTARTSITQNGKCRSCSHQLSPLKLSIKDLKKLRTIVRERVIVGADVYRKTTPQEYKNFLLFFERTKPYDVVIDGLNVGFVSKTNMAPDGLQITQLVKKCHDMGKRALVLGRKHMYRWKNLDINYIKSVGNIFLTDDRSSDDSFLLYATLSSGPHAKFISKDLMRQHQYLLGDKELMRIFKHWQMASQLTPVMIPGRNGLKMILKNPPKYLSVAQGDHNYWHLPYTSDAKMQRPAYYQPPQEWVCFRKKFTDKKV